MLRWMREGDTGMDTLLLIVGIGIAIWLGRS